MNMLLLTTPAQHQGTNPAVLVDEKQLQKWLDALPVMNVVETVKLLHAALVPFNELQLDNATRLKLLERYRQAIDEIFYSYDDMRLKQLPISNEARQDIKTDIMWLYLELANGYKIIVKNALDEGLNPKKDNSLLLSIYRAMEQIIHALVNAYRNYQAPPPLAYLEVNQLYLVTTENLANDRKVSSAKRESTSPTVDNLYKQFMLLAIANPMSMPEGVAFDLFFILEQVATHCLIGTEPPVEAGQHVYLVSLTDDAIPVPCSGTGSAAVNPDQRYLDIRPVMQVVRKRLDELQKSAQGLMDSQEVKLLRVYVEQIQGGAGGVTRASARSAYKQVQLAFGLDPVHYFMSDDHFAEHRTTSTESFGIEVRDVDSVEAMYELETWQILETGKTGRMLLVPKDISYQDLEPGLIVGIFEELGEGKPPVFSLGTIRWLPQEDAAEKKMGLQMIAGRPIPVTCSAGQDEAFFNCLYLTEVAVLKQPATLIMPRHYYQEGREIILRVPQGDRRIRLAELIDHTESIAQCRFDTA